MGTHFVRRHAPALRGVLGAGAAAALLAGLTGSPALGAAAATGQITGLAGKCMDVAAAGSANGTPVQLYDCNGSNAQQWDVGSDGSIKALGKCLDVTSAGTANGSTVQLWDCNGSTAQRWTVTAAHDIVNPQADKCLDVTGNSSANGTRLQIWTCTGTANRSGPRRAAGETRRRRPPGRWPWLRTSTTAGAARPARRPS